MSACCYLETINPYIECDFSVEPSLLFSFYGLPQSTPRREIMKLNHPRGFIKASYHDMYSKEKPKDLQLRYAELLTDSKFVLCPKGIGPSSGRIFETMRAGRVPVIISDDWVPPKGLDWNECAVFIREDQVNKIPEILAREEANWEKKAKLSQQYWNQLFAPEAVFNYFVDSLVELKKNQKELGPRMLVYHAAAFLKYGFRNLVIQRIKPILKQVGIRK
jgi:hypothetical protein